VWKQIIDFGRQLFTLTARVQKHEEDIKDLRQGLKEVRDEIRETNRKLDLLAVVVQRLDLRLDHERETAARDRENLILRLDNTLLRFERRLPPSSPPDDAPAP
jgi:chromosome segregation ATPase